MKNLIAPFLTEKSAKEIDQGLYVFTVTKEANKQTIAAEIKAIYNVEPLAVRVVNLPAKRVVFRRRKGVRPVRRKAYIQLPANKSLPGFEVLKENKKDAEKETK